MGKKEYPCRKVLFGFLVGPASPAFIYALWVGAREPIGDHQLVDMARNFLALAPAVTLLAWGMFLAPALLLAVICLLLKPARGWLAGISITLAAGAVSVLWAIFIFRQKGDAHVLSLPVIEERMRDGTLPLLFLAGAAAAIVAVRCLPRPGSLGGT